MPQGKCGENLVLPLLLNNDCVAQMRARKKPLSNVGLRGRRSNALPQSPIYININMRKLFLVLVIISCSGCSTMGFSHIHSKFYIKIDNAPTITNDGKLKDKQFITITNKQIGIVQRF